MRACPSSWLLLAVACGRTTAPAEAPPELEPMFVSGERLRARVADAGDGATRLLDWYDTELETTCTFQPMADGVYRCVPAGERPNLGAFWSYADADCSMALELSAICPGVPGTYVASYLPPRPEPYTPWTAPAVACGTDISEQPPAGTPVGAFRLGDALPTGQPVFEMAQAECVPGEALGDLFHLEPVAPESLVAATRHFEARGQRLTLQVLQGEDGSRVSSVVYDTQRKRPCSGNYRSAHVEDLGCFALSDDNAADEACERFGVVAACDDELTTVADNARPLGEWFHRLGQRIETTRARRGFPGAGCSDESWPLPEGLQLFEVGEPFAITQLPGLTLGLLGAGRVRVPFTRPRDDSRPLHVNGAGNVTPHFKPGPFWDSEQERACDLQLGSDGVTRCFPTQIEGTRYYADADCSVPLLSSNWSGQLNPTLVQTFLTSAEMCENEHLLGRLFITAEKISLDHYFVMNLEGACNRFEGPDEFYELIEADLDDFAEVTVAIE